MPTLVGVGIAIFVQPAYLGIDSMNVGVRSVVLFGAWVSFGHKTVTLHVGLLEER